MSNQFIWSYLIHLGDNMWGDYGPEYGGECIKTKPLKCEDKAWTELTNYIKSKNCCNTILIDVGEGLQYETYPEISAPGAWSKEKLSDEISRLRGMGFKVYPKLNFSAVHHNWLKEYSRMVSSKIYRQMTVDLINEVCDLFDKPELFHLGMDEEHSYNCAQWSELTVMRSPALMLEDFNIMFDAVRKNGSRPWIWADLYWNHPDFFMENVDKDIVLSNWFYLHFMDFPESDYHKRVIEAFKIFDEAGYDQIPTCSTYANQTNPAETILFAPTVIRDEHLLGYCNAPWLQVRENNEHLLLDSVERLWYARKRFAPETLK
jgi:hypothetical protein